MLQNTSSLIQKRTYKDKLFKSLCKAILFIYLTIMGSLVSVIVKKGISAFLIVKVRVDDIENLKELKPILSSAGLNKAKIEEHSFKGAWLETKGIFSVYYKSSENYMPQWNSIITKLRKKKYIKIRPSFNLIKNSDSAIQEEAGIRGAIKGTVFLSIIFLFCGSIIGISTGIYLVEFAKSKKLKNFISLNISNLASIPPIIYGIFGLSFLVNIIGIPRSSSLLGGMILSVLTLPIIVIVTTDSLNNVPSHLKFSAKALGLTHQQTVLRVCLPYAFPRILTGILLVFSRGISEATPLIIIGMASFISASPKNFFEPSTSIATQIYLWVNNPDVSFLDKVYGSIFILLIIISITNLTASFIRYRVSKRNIIR